MKVGASLASIAVFGLVLSASVFARDSNSGKFTLLDTAKVGATELQPGDYKAEWSGPADNLQVSIMQHGQTVATAKGSLKDLGKPSTYDAVAESTLPDQSKKIDEIDFNNKSAALVIGVE